MIETASSLLLPLLYRAVSQVTAGLFGTAADGFIGNRADVAACWALKKGWTSLKSLRTTDPHLNHDLQRAVRKSYLLATEELIRQAAHRLEVSEAARGILSVDLLPLARKLGSEVARELNQLDRELPEVDLRDTDLLAMDEGTAPKARWTSMQSAQRETLLGDVQRWLQKEPAQWLDVLDELLENGWQLTLESGAVVERDWHGLISIAFMEELKTQPRLSTVFEARILAELKNHDSRLEPVSTFGGFQVVFDRILPPLDRVERSLTALRTDIFELKNDVRAIDHKLSAASPRPHLSARRWVYLAAGVLLFVVLAWSFLPRPAPESKNAQMPEKAPRVSGAVNQKTGDQSPAIANTQTGNIDIRYGVTTGKQTKGGQDK